MGHRANGRECAQSRSLGLRCGGTPTLPPENTRARGAYAVDAILTRTLIFRSATAQHNSACVSSSVAPVAIARLSAAARGSQCGVYAPDRLPAFLPQCH